LQAVVEAVVHLRRDAFFLRQRSFRRGQVLIPREEQHDAHCQSRAETGERDSVAMQNQVERANVPPANIVAMFDAVNAVE
jgi:hypothetical protein